MISYLWVLPPVFLGYLLFRNLLVYRFKKRMLNRIHDRNLLELDEEFSELKAKIDQGDTVNGYKFRDYLWRYAEMNAVSYEKMLLQFWRPLRSFYQRDPARPYAERDEMSDLTE